MRQKWIAQIELALQASGTAFSPDVIKAALPLGQKALSLLDCNLALQEVGIAVSLAPLSDVFSPSHNTHRIFGHGLYLDSAGEITHISREDIKNKSLYKTLKADSIENILVFHDMTGFGAGSDDNSSQESEIKHIPWFWPALWRSRVIFAKVLTTSFVINVLSIAVPLIIMAVYDRVLPNFALDSLKALLVAGVFVLVSDFVLRTLRAYFIDAASANLDMELSDHLYNKILGMRMSARPLSSGVMANSVKELDLLRDFFTSATVIGLVDLPFVFIFFFVISMVGGPMVYILMVIAAILLILGLLVGIPLNILLSKTLKQEENRMGVLFETLSNVETLKVLDAGPTFRKRWRQSNADSTLHAKWTRGLSMLVSNASTVAQQTATIAMLGYGVFLVKDNELTAGALIACVILSGRALAPMAQVANILTRINHAKVAYRSLNNVMQAESDRMIGERYLYRGNLEPSIALQSVGFGYPGQARPCLSDISLNFGPGKKVGLLGRVGAGKSTLLSLMAGLHTPGAGQLLIGGANIEQLDPSEVRMMVGAVLQDAFLFKGTLRENLTLGKPDATDTEIIAAAKITGLDAFVTQDETGYDRIIGERGLGLSGGQRQAVALTRMLVRNPPILLLDEPTSAMDTASEQLLIEKLKPTIKDKTVVIATHKMAMLELVDYLVVIDGGHVVASGPKKDVLAALKSGKINQAGGSKGAA